MIASVSPLKPSIYFDGELTDGDTKVRFVGFRKEQREILHTFCEEKSPSPKKLPSKFYNHLEIVLKGSSQVEVSEADFHVTNLKTVGSSEIQLCDLDKHDEYTRVTFSAQVAKVSEPRSVGAGKTKQEVLLCDASGSATLTLWEDDVNMLTENKSYQMNRLVVRSFLGKNYLSMPPSGATIDENEDLEEVKTPSTS